MKSVAAQLVGMMAGQAISSPVTMGELIPVAGVVNGVTGQYLLQNNRRLSGKERARAGGEVVASFFAAPVIAKGLGVALVKFNSLGALAKSQVSHWWDKDLSLFQESKGLNVYHTVTSEK